MGKNRNIDLRSCGRRNPLSVAIGAMGLWLLVACTDEGSAHRALVSSGYTGIKFTGYSVSACGSDDTTATGFTAINPAGHLVSGTVCCGLLIKGCTVRF